MSYPIDVSHSDRRVGISYPIDVSHSYRREGISYSFDVSHSQLFQRSRLGLTQAEFLVPDLQLSLEAV